MWELTLRYKEEAAMTWNWNSRKGNIGVYIFKLETGKDEKKEYLGREW